MIPSLPFPGVPSLPSLPSLHGIVEAIAKGFFQALAHALVPSWLTHGTVATIQHLVALPDPASWSHVARLQGDMIYMGAMLLPATLAVGTVRYWLLGFTGAGSPMLAVGRSVWAAFVLLAYGWLVEQVVAIANTLSHAVLGLPVVAEGLRRIVGVLFGGALLGGAGGVFGALLVIFGVLLAAGLFAAQVALTVVLGVLIAAGPPLIALTPIPELAHLARVWAHALLAVALVPLGWTILFATAGALCLDATSFTGGASGGLPGHVAAAFAGLVTFALALKLALLALGELRNLFVPASGAGAAGASGQSTMPAAQRVRTAHARLRSATFEGIPSLGRSAGAAAGALGAPAGGAIGIARRRMATRGEHPRPQAAARNAQSGSRVPVGAQAPGRAGLRERLRNARAIVTSAPREARRAMSAGAPGARRAVPATARAAAKAAQRGMATGSSTPSVGARSSVSVAGAESAANPAPARGSRGAASAAAARAAKRVSNAQPMLTSHPPSTNGTGAPAAAARARSVRKVTAETASRPERAPKRSGRGPSGERPAKVKPNPAPLPPAPRHDRRPPSRKPRPKGAS